MFPQQPFAQMNVQPMAMAAQPQLVMAPAFSLPQTSAGYVAPMAMQPSVPCFQAMQCMQPEPVPCQVQPMQPMSAVASVQMTADGPKVVGMQYMSMMPMQPMQPMPCQAPCLVPVAVPATGSASSSGSTMSPQSSQCSLSPAQAPCATSGSEPMARFPSMDSVSTVEAQSAQADQWLPHKQQTHNVVLLGRTGAQTQHPQKTSQKQPQHTCHPLSKRQQKKNVLLALKQPPQSDGVSESDQTSGESPKHKPAPRTEVSPAEIILGIQSLYKDELKPYGRILRKRLVELSNEADMGDLDMSIKDLRVACEACSWLEVQDYEGADWAVTLKGQDAHFIDIYSPKDEFPDEMWLSAAKYFGNLDTDDMVLPGGRYSCAQVLMERKLPFLEGRSLGAICHIIQLSISQKKLLGYLSGTVVPYSQSQSMIKEKNAECQRPCTSPSTGKVPVVTWDSMRGCLQTLVADMNNGEQTVPLSNIKRLFRTRFNMELSETALGYAKLSELLQDDRLAGLCDVKLKGHGYVIMPKTDEA